MAKSTPYLGARGKKRRDLILYALGDKYSYKYIDGEKCIYRKLNDHYDIEISGAGTLKYQLSINIYVWSLNPLHTVEIFFDIETLEELQEVLTHIEQKYT